MEQIKKFLHGKGFALVLAACLLAAAAAGVWAVRTVRDELKQNLTDLTNPSSTARQTIPEPEPDPEPEQPKSSGGTLLLVLAVAVIGGAAGWYFKIYRPKKQQAADAAEDYGDDYDDTPPWEDEDETESEGEE